MNTGVKNFVGAALRGRPKHEQGFLQQPAKAGRPLPVVFAILLGAPFLWPAKTLCAQEGTNALPADPLAGRQVFLEKGCSKCHAIWSEGGTLGPDLGKAGVWHSVMQLAGVLWNHSPEMIEKMRERHIPRPTISTTEMADLAAFLYFLNYFDPPGEFAKGEILFSQKGYSKCHSVGETVRWD